MERKLPLLVAVALALAGLLLGLFFVAGEDDAPGFVPLRLADAPSGDRPERDAPRGLDHPVRSTGQEGSGRVEAANRVAIAPDPGTIQGRISRKGIPSGSMPVVLQYWGPAGWEEYRSWETGVLYGPRREPVASTYEAKRWTENTDREGRFHFEGLPPGAYGLTVELESGTDWTYGWIQVEPGQRVNLGTLFVPDHRSRREERPDRVRLLIHARNHQGPVAGLRVEVRTTGEVQLGHAAAVTDERGERQVEITGDEPIRIDLIGQGGQYAGGTGAPRWYTPGGVHDVWLSVETGDLAVSLPQRPSIARGQALQYVLESPLLPGDSLYSSTEIGGTVPPENHAVTYTASGCVFHNLAAGNYSVKATMLQKNHEGRWLPTGLRYRGSATIVEGQTVACAMN